MGDLVRFQTSVSSSPNLEVRLDEGIGLRTVPVSSVSCFFLIGFIVRRCHRICCCRHRLLGSSIKDESQFLFCGYDKPIVELIFHFSSFWSIPLHEGVKHHTTTRCIFSNIAHPLLPNVNLLKLSQSFNEVVEATSRVVVKLSIQASSVGKHFKMAGIQLVNRILAS